MVSEHQYTKTSVWQIDHEIGKFTFILIIYSLKMDLVPIGESKIERRILFAGKSAKNKKSTVIIS